MMDMSDTLQAPSWTLGDRLSKARRHAGIGSEEMAVKLGISRTTVSNYESGRTDPTIGMIRGWADVCQVPLEWLIRSRCSSERYQGFPALVAA